MSNVSIAILTYNGERYLREVLAMIARQKLKAHQILAIDSGSVDGTIGILRDAQVELHEISNEEFSHSRTRNLAAQIATGQYLVFLTQDATPVDSCWLDRLLQPLKEEPQTAGVFSRQIPRYGGDPLEANDLYIYFNRTPEIKRLPPNPLQYRKNIWHYIQFSNSSAAYNRRLLLQYPFDETLTMGEDQEWAKRMLEKDYSIVYQPESVVLHSHNHGLRQKYNRDFTMGLSFSCFLSPMLGRRHFPLGAFLGHIYLDARYLIRSSDPFLRKAKWLILSPLHRATTHFAYYKGWNSVTIEEASKEAKQFAKA